MSLINRVPEWRQARIVGARESADETEEGKQRFVTMSLSSEAPYVRRFWFSDPVVEVLGHKKSEVDIDRFEQKSMPLLWGHDSHSRSNHLGKYVKLWFEKSVLMGEAVVSNRSELDDFYQDVQDGNCTEVSVSYDIEKMVKTKEGDPEDVADLDEYRVTKWAVLEGSFVSVPADYGVGSEKAREQRSHALRSLIVNVPLELGSSQAFAAGSRSAEDEDDEDDANDSDGGSQEADENDSAHDASTDDISGENEMRVAPKKKDDDSSTEAEVLAEYRAAEKERRSAIIAAFSHHPAHEKLMNECLLDDECTAQMAGERLIKALANPPASEDGDDDDADETATPTQRANTPATPGVDWTDNFLRLACDATMVRGCNRGDFQFKPEVKDNPFLDYTMPDLARHYLTRKGKSAIGANNVVMARAMGINADNDGRPNFVRAGMGTGDFPYLLMDVMEKSMSRGFDETPATWMGIARNVPLAGLRPSWRTTIEEIGEMEFIPEHGEYPYMQLGDEGDPVALGKYGQTYELSLEAVWSDDLDQLTRFQAWLGRTAQRNRNDMTIMSVMKNRVFHRDNVLTYDTATHQNHNMNMFADDFSVPNADMNIKDSVASMKYFARRHASSISGRNVDVTLKTILTPLTVEDDFETFLSKKHTNNPSALEEPNVYQGKFQQISHARIEQTIEELIASGDLPGAGDPVETRKSLNTVVAVADHADMDTVEFYTLQGQETPYYEASQGFNYDGIRYKVRDFTAVSVRDWRALQRHTINISAADITR